MKCNTVLRHSDKFYSERSSFLASLDNHKAVDIFPKLFTDNCEENLVF